MIGLIGAIAVGAVTNMPPPYYGVYAAAVNATPADQVEMLAMPLRENVRGNSTYVNTRRYLLGPDNPGYFTGPEAYVCYTDDNTTLTFYYDHYRSSRPGETYELNEGSDAPGWASYYETTRVVFDLRASSRPRRISRR